MTKRRTTLRKLAATALMILAVHSSAQASPASRLKTREAFRLAYGLKFEDAYKAFAEAAEIDPNDPAPPRGHAAVLWIETLFAQGAATFEAFTGQVSSRRDVTRPTVPAPLTARFRAQIDRALALAERQMHAAPDADAHYQMGATSALAAIYAATVEGRTFGSFSAARRAVRMMERVRALEPHARETGLVLGMSRYTVSTMSAPVRMLAGMAGLSGGRDDGIALIEEAASPGAETEHDALLVLMIIYNREARVADALNRLEQLQAAFPTNRLLPLNIASTALAAGEFELAERRLVSAMATHDLGAPPMVLGEQAMWYQKRGTARASLGRDALAQNDLSTVLTLSPRDWVRGRAHLELARLALKTGDRNSAKSQLHQALLFAQRSGDGVAVRQTRDLSRQLR